MSTILRALHPSHRTISRGAPSPSTAAAASRCSLRRWGAASSSRLCYMYAAVDGRLVKACSITKLIPFVWVFRYCKWPELHGRGCVFLAPACAMTACSSVHPSIHRRGRASNYTRSHGARIVIRAFMEMFRARLLAGVCIRVSIAVRYDTGSMSGEEQFHRYFGYVLARVSSRVYIPAIVVTRKDVISYPIGVLAVSPHIVRRQSEHK